MCLVLKHRRQWSSNTKSKVAKVDENFIFDKLQTSPACGVFDYRSMLHHSRGENKPAHRRGPVPMTGLLPTRNTLPHTHAQQQHRHRTPFRDIRHVLTTAKFTWHWSVWSDPRKATWTHKRAGAFVFVECHTSSRGKPATGPGRPLKPEGGVCGNRLCGYL